MLHINQYPVWPDGTRKKQSGFGPLSGTLIEKYDARYAFNPMDLVNPSNPYGIPTFLWIDGNGAGATIGPAGLDLVETGVGALVSGSPMPYQYPSGVAATGERYDGVNYRTDTVRRLAPTDTNDIVVAVKIREQNFNWSGAGGGTNTYFATIPWRVNNGYQVRLVNGDFVFYYARYSVFVEKSVVMGVAFCRTPNILIGIVNRSATSMTGFCNGVVGTTDNTLPVGSISGTGISIGAAPNGDRKAGDGTQIEWISVWYGDDIYETWRADSDRLIKRLSMESLGLRETITNSKYWFYSPVGGVQGMCSYKDHDDRWWFSGKTAPRAGNAKGVVAGIYGNNQAVGGAGGVRNADPTGVVGWTVTGGVLTVVSDAAALAAVKAETWGPNVYSFVNATGVPQTVHLNQSSTMTRSVFMVLGRYVAGAGASMGWWDHVANTFTPVVTILDNYTLTRYAFSTPANTDSGFGIQIPDGCELLFIGQQLSKLSATAVGAVEHPIPYLGSPWSNIHQVDTLTTEHTPVAGSGSYLINLAPLEWSGTETGIDNTVLPCVTTPGDILHAESIAAGWATSDGTTQIQTVAPYVPTAGVYVDVWSAWRAALQYIQQGVLTPASLVTGAYDGGKGMVGALKLQPATDGGSYAVKYIEVRQV